MVKKMLEINKKGVCTEDILKQDIKYKICREKNEWIWLNQNFKTSVLKEIIARLGKCICNIYIEYRVKYVKNFYETIKSKQLTKT